MAKSIAQLKKNRGASLASLQDEVKKHGKKDFTDARFWKPTRNNEGSVFAEIRFLPAPQNGDWGEENDPFVKFFTHSFKGPSGKYYIEQCLSSIGDYDSDPVMVYNNVLYDKIGTKESKDQGRKQGRKKRYIANILVVRDPAKPDNVGKVLLWEFGQKIFDKLSSAIAPPQDSGRAGVDVFDPWDGVNFHIEAHPNTVDGFKFLDYAQSQFGQPSPLFEGDDAKITALWEQQHSLNQFLSVENKDFYKPWDDLVKNLERAMGAKWEQLLDPTFVPSTTGDPMAGLEKQQGTLKNYLEEDAEEDNIPDFVVNPVPEPETATAAPVEEVTTPPIPEVNNDLQGLADLEGLDDI